MVNTRAINNPRYKESFDQEQVVIDKIHKKWKGIKIVETDKRKFATIDNLILKDNVISAAMEIKTRDYSFEDLVNLGGTFLVSNSKIIDGQHLSRILKVPFFIFGYLKKNDMLLYWKITNDEGTIILDFEVKKSKTKYDIIGGEIYRENAFLDLSKSITL